jgi:CBS domain-containing protein
MTIEQFIRRDVVTATMDASAAELARLMKDEAVGSVVVVSGETPVGIVTDRDIVLYVVAVDSVPVDVTARDLMSEDLFTVDTEAETFAVMGRMADAGVRRVPVVEGGSLVGIVTLDDLVVVLANELGSLAGVIEGEMPNA